MQPPQNKSAGWSVAHRVLNSSPIPRLVGILNLTPDSFSDGGRFADPAAAVAAARQLEVENADIIDLGAESSRPGSALISAAEEIQRLMPVLQLLRPTTSCLLSIDTMKAAVAERALAAGADIINDVSGLRFDGRMQEVCAASTCGVILMHMQGTPQTMQQDPRYDDVIGEIVEFFEERLLALERAGIGRERVILDPGIGFGKTPGDNLKILQAIPRFRELGRPVLIGHSRKRFLGKLLGRPVEERHAGTIGVSLAAAALGADYLRVHDVAGNYDALCAWRAVLPQ